jgi:hypothetical protein
MNLLPDPQAWPGGSLLAPGGTQLQQALAQACLATAMAVVGLAAAGGFAGGGRSGAVRQPPQVEDAADGEERCVFIYKGCSCLLFAV